MKLLLSCFVLVFYCQILFSQSVFYVAPNTPMRSENGATIVFDNMSLVDKSGFKQDRGEGKSVFTGDKDVNISGSQTLMFDQLVINKEGDAKVNLLSGASVKTSLIFKHGLLNIENSIIDLGTEGVLSGENEQSRAYTLGRGYLQASRNLNSPSYVNPGNLGAIISSNQNLGVTVVKRGHSYSLNGSDVSVKRYYEIGSSDKNFTNASLRFNYFKAELNNLDEAGLSLFEEKSNSVYNEVGVTNRSILNSYIEVAGINPVSKWTLFSGGNDVISVYPTFVTKTVTVNISPSTDTKVHLVLYSVNGQPILTEDKNLVAGKNQFELNLNGIVAGSYVLQIGYGTSTKNFKLIKQN